VYLLASRDGGSVVGGRWLQVETFVVVIIYRSSGSSN
jgi:hypothetical protein